MARFFIRGELAEKMTLNGLDAHHASHVLRLKPGDEIIVVDSLGKAAKARLETGNSTETPLTFIEKIDVNSEPPITVYLAQGLAKGDKMDYIVQKAVELGVNKIIPLIADHSVVRYDLPKQANRRERWQKIALEASKQCGRLTIPEVTTFQDMKKLLAGYGQNFMTVMLYEGERKNGLKTLLQGCPARAVLLLIGPEGGFSDGEVTFCRQQGIRTASLGPRILRTETAALAALSIVMYECGDLGGY